MQCVAHRVSVLSSALPDSKAADDAVHSTLPEVKLPRCAVEETTWRSRGNCLSKCSICKGTYTSRSTPLRRQLESKAVPSICGQHSIDKKVETCTRLLQAAQPL